MQRWWLVVAGVVGIGLAVLLVPRPDTGAEVVDRGAVVATGEAKRFEDGSEPTLVGRTPVGEPEPEPVDLGPDGLPRTIEPIGLSPIDKDPPVNPRAARISARMDTPEGRYAGKALAPWTQVRRELVSQTADAGPVGADVERMIEDMRVMLRDPPSTDAAEIEARQVQLISDLRASEYHNEGVEKMLVLIEDRLDEYRADRDGTAPAAPPTTP